MRIAIALLALSLVSCSSEYEFEQVEEDEFEQVEEVASEEAYFRLINGKPINTFTTAHTSVICDPEDRLFYLFSYGEGIEVLLVEENSEKCKGGEYAAR